MDSEKGNRVFARGGTMCPPLVFGAQKKPGLDRVKLKIDTPKINWG